jgi:hypothetical protein
MEAILWLYRQEYDPNRPLVCFDEASYQLLGHTREPIAVRPGLLAKQDSEYKRKGTRNLFMFVEPKAGKRAVLVTRQRTKQDFAYAMRYLVDVLYPHAACIDVVLDNLNTHRYMVLIEIFGKKEADRIMNRLCLHYTPPHGSWLNMAEIEIGIMRHHCLRRRIADEWTLRAELMSWEMHSNRMGRKIHWSFTVDDARRVFKEHYPSKLKS